MLDSVPISRRSKGARGRSPPPGEAAGRGGCTATSHPGPRAHLLHAVSPALGVGATLPRCVLCPPCCGPPSPRQTPPPLVLLPRSWDADTMLSDVAGDEDLPSRQVQRNERSLEAVEESEALCEVADEFLNSLPDSVRDNKPSLPRRLIS